MARSEAPPAGLRAGALEPDDIADAMALSQEAGWNQVAADWAVLLELGSGIGLRDRTGRLVATAITLPYGDRVAWISMVLVTAAHRGRGVGRWLVRECLAGVLGRGLMPILDATEAGRRVYRGFGFEDAWRINRMVAREAPAQGRRDDVSVRVLRAQDWPLVQACDRDGFGANRSALLHDLAARLPQAALIAERGGRFAGFLLGRDGRLATQLGPLVADDDAVARALLAEAIGRVRVPLAVDLAERHGWLGTWLASCGFVEARQWTRMVYGGHATFDDPARLFATAGPELG